MNIDEMKFGELEQIAAMFKQPESKGIGQNFVGKYVIVRSYNEGINAGYVVEMDDTGIVLKEARRIWYHRPADKSQSWYEGVALSGLSADSKLSPVVQHKVIMEDYSITECTELAQKSIESKEAHAQS